ncbi:acylglycerol kinase, mitochondrial isoform X2 [Callorhinchus milii]|uniref:acylglycerol kinase, mitochondrial isoform X2 n=1 Tax=Callorhinchus milii TaxID=7868 RepID=UPI00045719AD|nr:acylglycerol kinase, mitochondrial isoform X2 [Callorhinchus milii]|eukprot:gi/632973711/ref/XP_007903286.1/ PREDICTED: acylglycerol kinase, mitochondrial isoform X2 [Callorhinchus milii]
MARLLRTVRNHWKKSTFGVCALSCGAKWVYNRHCDSLLRRAACQEAKEYGDQLLPVSAKVKKATVFLNPAACNGKARNLFEKNAAPILHLSGFDVNVVKTDYEGQAKKLLELVEDTDLIIVAGGDGTLQEVVTGLLRRADVNNFSKIPIGFIPLGNMNSLSQTLYPAIDEKTRHIVHATLAILKGETVTLDVLEIKGDKEQPVFAVTGLRWGAYRDASSKLSKFWYLGPLKDKACHLFSMYKEWPQVYRASLAYLGPTERPPEESDEKPPRPGLWRRILRRLELYFSSPKEEQVPMEPEHWDEVEASAVEVTISTLNKQMDLTRTQDAMTVCIEPATLSKEEFLATGSQKISEPHMCPEGSQILQASCCRLQLPQGTEGFFSIDNEDYEAMSVDVKLLPRKLRFFCDSIKKQQMQR